MIAPAGLYASDQWAFRPNMTLTFGLRADMIEDALGMARHAATAPSGSRSDSPPHLVLEENLILIPRLTRNQCNRTRIGNQGGPD